MRTYLREVNTLSRMRQRDSLKRQAVAYKGGRCVDCGYSDLTHIRVFEFDHLPGSMKESALARMLQRCKWPVVVKELDKCELVCANCHAIRTESRFHAGKTLVSVAPWSANGAKNECKRGHPYDEENTYKRPDGYRDCRACRKYRKKMPKTPCARAKGMV